MTRLIPSWTTIYAGAVLSYSVILIVVGAWLFPVMTHGGPLGLPFLVLGLLFAPLSIGLWFGHVWVGILAFAISLFPGVPLLWKDVVACGKPLARWLPEVSFARCCQAVRCLPQAAACALVAPSVAIDRSVRLRCSHRDLRRGPKAPGHRWGAPWGMTSFLSLARRDHRTRGTVGPVRWSTGSSVHPE